MDISDSNNLFKIFGTNDSAWDIGVNFVTSIFNAMDKPKIMKVLTMHNAGIMPYTISSSTNT